MCYLYHSSSVVLRLSSSVLVLMLGFMFDGRSQSSSSRSGSSNIGLVLGRAAGPAFGVPGQLTCGRACAFFERSSSAGSSQAASRELGPAPSSACGGCCGCGCNCSSFCSFFSSSSSLPAASLLFSYTTKKRFRIGLSFLARALVARHTWNSANRTSALFSWNTGVCSAHRENISDALPMTSVMASARYLRQPHHICRRD